MKRQRATISFKVVVEDSSDDGLTSQHLAVLQWHIISMFPNGSLSFIECGTIGATITAEETLQDVPQFEPFNITSRDA